MMPWITVSPAASGWTLDSSELSHPMTFRSGKDAEREARGLAGRLSAAGVTTVVTLRLRDGSIASRFACPAADILGVTASDATGREAVAA